MRTACLETIHASVSVATRCHSGRLGAQVWCGGGVPYPTYSWGRGEYPTVWPIPPVNRQMLVKTTFPQLRLWAVTSVTRNNDPNRCSKMKKNRHIKCVLDIFITNYSKIHHLTNKIIHILRKLSNKSTLAIRAIVIHSGLLQGGH